MPVSAPNAYVRSHGSPIHLFLAPATLASRHEQDAMLRSKVDVRRGDQVPPANVEAALALATELVNLGEAAFRRDLSTPQARRDFKVSKTNRGLRSGGVVC